MALKTVILPIFELVSVTGFSGASLTNLYVGPDLSHDDDSSVAEITEPATGRIRFTLRDKPNDIYRVVSVKPSARDKVGSGSTNIRIWMRLGAELSDAFAYTLASSGSYTDHSGAVSAPGGGIWTPQLIANPNLEIDYELLSWIGGSGDTHRDTSLWVVLEYEPIPHQADGAHDATGRGQWVSREPSRVLHRQHLDLADAIELDLLGRVNISHAFGPEEAGLGWRSKPWQRRFCRLEAQTFHPGTPVVDAEYLDIRSQLCMYRDTAWSRISSAPWGDGVSRFSQGCTLTFSRNSRAWVEDPSNGRIRQVEVDQEQIGEDGLLIERAATNYIYESAFTDGFFFPPSPVLEWFFEGTGSNGSDIVLDSTELIFDEDEIVTGNAAKLIAGDPIHVSDLTMRAAETETVPAGGNLSLSFEHRALTGAHPLYWKLRRNADFKWWVPGTGWTDETWNAAGGADTERVRTKINQIDVGGADSTFNLWIGIPTASGVAGQQNRLWHVQLEGSPYVTSHIVTLDGGRGAYTREASDRKVSNATGKRPFTIVQGAAFFRCVSLWSGDADEVTGKKTVYYAPLSGSDYVWLYYDADNLRWVHERSISSTIYRAVLDDAPSAGGENFVGARWVGAQQELGLAAQTLSVFVNGVKGTDVVSAAGSDPSSSFVWFGSKSGTSDFFDGHVTLHHFFAYVPTDNECARLPPR